MLWVHGHYKMRFRFEFHYALSSQLLQDEVTLWFSLCYITVLIIWNTLYLWSMVPRKFVKFQCSKVASGTQKACSWLHVELNVVWMKTQRGEIPLLYGPWLLWLFYRLVLIVMKWKRNGPTERAHTQKNLNYWIIEQFKIYMYIWQFLGFSCEICVPWCAIYKINIYADLILFSLCIFTTMSWSYRPVASRVQEGGISETSILFYWNAAAANLSALNI